jgi:hypothetical protein
MDLAEAIKLFREDHPEWAYQANALYRCDQASKLFLQFLADNFVLCGAKPYTFDLDRPSSCVMSPQNPCSHGFESNQNINPNPAVYRGGSNEAGCTRASWHYIVETDTCFIDWTARQYTLSVEYPHIIPKVTLSTAPLEWKSASA